jgi:hypothetical protein
VWKLLNPKPLLFGFFHFEKNEERARWRHLEAFCGSLEYDIDKLLRRCTLQFATNTHVWKFLSPTESVKWI